MPDRIEQIARAVEVDRVALVEIQLRLAGHDRGEMKDDVRPVRDQAFGERRIGDVAGIRAHRETGVRKRRWRNDVDRHQRIDRRSADGAITREALAQLAPDHSGRARHKYLHAASFPHTVAGKPHATKLT